jgi:hypothetical protein
MGLLINVMTFLQKRKTLVLFVGGLLVGLLLGLLFAWVVWPVQWENAAPGHLRADYQRYYLRCVADEYLANGDVGAMQRHLGLDLKAKQNPWVKTPALLGTAMDSAAQEYSDRAPIFQQLKGMVAAPLATAGVTPAAGTTPQPTGGGKLPITTICGLLLVVFALVVGAYFLITRQRAAKKPAPARKPVAPPPGGEVLPGPEGPEGGEPEPVTSFMANYVLGDDYFDPSFSIEVGPDFLGECGVGVSETIGVADPKKVTAFEVWLFDKSDIRTITTVVASEYAFNDPALQAKLAPKGEIVLAKPGAEVVLETSALRVRAIIKAADYAQGNLPPGSFFQRLSLELRAWVKSNPQPPA